MPLINGCEHHRPWVQNAPTLPLLFSYILKNAGAKGDSSLHSAAHGPKAQDAHPAFSIFNATFPVFDTCWILHMRAFS